MTLPLREYLAQRRADIQANIKAFRAELAEIDAAERALGDTGSAAVKQKRTRGSASSGKKTLKEMALEVLNEHPEGADSALILSEISRKFAIDVARESMSPQLSRLGHEGTVVREGFKWRLAIFTDEFWTPDESEAQKEETPDGYQPSDVSSLEVDLEDEVPF